MPADLERYLEVAVAAARAAGEQIRAAFGRPQRVGRKGLVNLVTEVDTRCEAIIREILRQACPGHRFLGEEGGEQGGPSPFLWLVDPLDGTTNFAHGYPFVAVSIGLEREGRVVVGVVHDPLRGETFTAAEGMGAWLDGRRLEVSGTRELGSALLVTGFPYDLRQHPRVTLDLFGDFCLAAQGVRRDGAAALDLCYVAAGRFDAMWEVGLSPWDMAAGSLIVREAGGMVTDMKGRPADVRTREMVASNVHLHRAMLDIIEPHLAALRASPYWRD